MSRSHQIGVINIIVVLTRSHQPMKLFARDGKYWRIGLATNKSNTELTHPIIK